MPSFDEIAIGIRLSGDSSSAQRAGSISRAHLVLHADEFLRFWYFYGECEGWRRITEDWCFLFQDEGICSPFRLAPRITILNLSRFPARRDARRLTLISPRRLKLPPHNIELFDNGNFSRYWLDEEGIASQQGCWRFISMRYYHASLEPFSKFIANTPKKNTTEIEHRECHDPRFERLALYSNFVF